MGAEKTVSTTALARLMGIDAKQVFRLLADKHWIKRVDDKWQLLAKGEFEGGAYQQSAQYGQYIVWPVSLVEHAIFQREELSLLGAAQLAADHNLCARQMNRLLAAIGWIKPALKGWQLTKLGESLGGISHRNEQSGSSYVLWPPAVQQAVDYQHALASINGQRLSQENYVALSGLPVKYLQHLSLANYLYLADVRFSYQARLPTQIEYYADFYLPQVHLYIEVWGVDENPHAVREKLTKQSWFKESDCRCLELNTEMFEDLDKHLSLALLDYGIAVY